MSKTTTGQITGDCDFGKALTHIAGLCDTIVEIGTWNGLGSTICLRRGITRPEQHLWSVESSDERWAEIQENWPDQSQITFIHGKALEVIDQLPPKIHLLLLDGDDLSTKQEFEALRDRCRYIAMDDTREIKCREARQYGLDHGWTLIADNQEERFGWSIFKVT